VESSNKQGLLGCVLCLGFYGVAVRRMRARWREGGDSPPAHPLYHYTNYIWLYVLLFAALPCRWVEGSLWFIRANVYGLLAGIHCFYSVDGYKLLWEFGRHKGVENKCIVLLGEALMHAGPLLLVKLLEATKWQGLPEAMPHWGGLLSGALHCSYGRIISGSWDPAPMYRVAPRPMSKVVTAWAGLLASHSVMGRCPRSTFALFGIVHCATVLGAVFDEDDASGGEPSII